MEPLHRRPPRPFRWLLDDAVVEARRHFRAVYLAVALPPLLTATLLTTVQTYWVVNVNQGLQQGATGTLLGAGLALVLILALLHLVVQWLSHSAVAVAAVDAAAGRPVSMAEAWRFMVRPSVLGTLMLVLVAVLVALVACCLPAVPVYLLLAFALPVMRAEGRYGIDAMGRSSRLAQFSVPGESLRGTLVKLFLLFVAALLVNGQLTGLAQIPLQVMQLVLHLRDPTAGGIATFGQGTGPGAWLAVPAGILGSLATSAAVVYAQFALVHLYSDTRRRREGDDLAAALRELREPGADETEPGAEHGTEPAT